jgi:hypothetical protein
MAPRLPKIDQIFDLLSEITPKIRHTRTRKYFAENSKIDQKKDL